MQSYCFGWRKPLAFATLFVAMVWGLAACGGGGGSSGSPGAGSTTGRVTVNIDWPDRSREVPGAAESVRIVAIQNGQQILDQVAARPVGGEAGAGAVTFEAPGGAVELRMTAHPDASGTGNAQAVGQTNVQVANGQTAEITAALSSTVMSVEINPRTLSSAVGRQGSVSATALDIERRVVLVLPEEIAWRSMNNDIVNVEGDGAAATVRCVGAGRARVRATYVPSGDSVDSIVDVQPAPVGGGGPVGGVVHQGVTITPPSTATRPFGSIQFSAVVDGSPSAAILWSVESDQSGSISADGLYQAPEAPGTYYVRATQVDDPLVTSTAAIVVEHWSGTALGLAHTPWPKYKGNLLGTGQGLGGFARGEEAWFFQTGAQCFASVVIGAGDRVYTGSYDGYVYCFDAISGEPKWAFKTGARVVSTPTLSQDGCVYAASCDGKLYALEAATGALRWSFVLTTKVGFVGSSPTVGPDGTVYAATMLGDVFAVDGSTGRQVWRFRRDRTWFFSSPALTNDGKLIIGASRFSTSVIALDAASGVVVWEHITSAQVDTSPAIDADGDVYVADIVNYVYRLDGATGRREWATTIPKGCFSSPAITSAGRLYIGSNNGPVYCLDTSDGRIRWTFDDRINAANSSPAVDTSGTVYIGDHRGGLYAIRESDGQLRWKFETGSSVRSSPAIGENGWIYFTTEGGTVYALR